MNRQNAFLNTSQVLKSYSLLKSDWHDVTAQTLKELEAMIHYTNSSVIVVTISSVDEKLRYRKFNLNSINKNYKKGIIKAWYMYCQP